MKKFLLVLMFCSPAVQAVGKVKPAIVVGADHACVLSRGVLCWGAEDYGQTSFNENGSNVISIAAGTKVTCTLNLQDQVICKGKDIGDYPSEHSLRLNLNKPHGLVVKDSYGCVLDDEGMKCFGNHPLRSLNVLTPSSDGTHSDIALKNAQKVFPGSDGICALDDDGLHCWGFAESKMPVASLPKFKNLKELVFGWSHFCAIDDSGLRCFGENDKGQIIAPALSHPHSLTADADTTCALDDEGSHCWGYVPDEESIPKTPRALVAAAGNICAIDDVAGITCAHKIAQIDPPEGFFPTFSNPQFVLDEASDFLRVIAPGSSAARGYLFSTLGNIHAKEIEQSNVTSLTVLAAANYLIVSLLEPAVLSGDSEYFIKSVVPAYQASMSKIATSGFFRKPADVPKAALTQRVALNVLQVSLLTLTEFMQPEDKVEIQKTVKLVGQAMATPSKESLQNVVSSLKSQEAIFKKIEESQKIFFLVKMIQNTGAWLD